MKILFVVKQKKNVDTFAGTIRTLLERGHRVTLTVQEGQEWRDDGIGRDAACPGFAAVRGPAARTDAWAQAALLLRSLRDCAHYLQPELRGAVKLQTRSVKKLSEDLQLPGDDAAVAEALRAIPPAQARRLREILDLTERALPPDPLWVSFIAEQAPDLVLVSPLVHFGSAQADVVAAARAAQVPVGMLLFSWDNLSTKGHIHRDPDWMFVWNERQRQEATALHGFPSDRVVVTGAPRFDAFFEKQPQLTREAFHEPLGLDPSTPTFLYVCSSPFVSGAELGFVRKWIDAVRHAACEPLRGANLIVRPHPDIDLLPRDEPMTELRWPGLPGLRGLVWRPFGDARAIVLRTSDHAMQGLYECLVHSAAVVGLNTSAELESAIAGVPVFTVLADASDADGQSGTVHFHYLVEANGGFVKTARTLAEHVDMLETELKTPTDRGVLRSFVSDFLRPLGIDRPVAPLLADAIERAFPSGSEAVRSGQPHAAPAGATLETEPDGDIPLPLGGKLAGLRLRVPRVEHEPARDRFKPDPTTVEWLREHVGIGEVVYDVGAGIGAYTVIAATQRGSIVVAFEPGYAAFRLLCDNLRLNGCAGSVIPMPLAVTGEDGMAELKYAPGRPGEERHVVHAGSWRTRRAGADERAFVQPVCAITLDAALARYALPVPGHLRIGEHTSVPAVLAGAAALLRSGALKTIFVTVPEDGEAALTTTLAATDWTVSLHKPISRGRVHMVGVR